MPDTEAAAALGRLEAFVELDGAGYRFRHALVREGAYEGLSYRVRRGLHTRASTIVKGRAGDELEEWDDLLSLHFTQAGDLRRSWRYSCLAGERARRTFAPVEAVAFYRRAVDAAKLLPDVPAEDLGGVLETLGGVLGDGGPVRGSRERLRPGPQGAGHEAVAAGRAAPQGGLGARAVGRYADALRWYSRGRHLLEAAESALSAATETSGVDPEALEAPQRLRARLALAAGAARLRQGRYRECLPLLHDAVALAEPLAIVRRSPHAYYLLDWAHTDLGNDERHHYSELSLPIYEELGNLARQGVVSSNLGIDAYFEGRWEAAVAWYRKGREASERAGDVVQMATATNNLGELESDRGHLDLARRLFTEAMQVWRAAPFPVGVALATSNLGRVAIRAGQLDEAKALLDEARRLFSGIGADSYVLETDAREVERLVAAGRGREALAMVADIDTRSERAGGLPLLMLMTHRMAGYATAQLGRFDDALGQLAEVEFRARQLGADFELALTLEAVQRELRADGRDASEPYRIAVGALFDPLGVMSTPAIPLPRQHVDLPPG